MKPVIRPTLEEFTRLSADYNVIPVYAEVLADTVTPISAYMNVVGDEPGFILESVEGGEKMGRYTFIGLDAKRIIFSSGGDPLEAIASRFDKLKPYHDPYLPRFCGGAVGFIGYDCVAYFEPKLAETHRAFPRPSLKLPESAFILADKLMIFDHVKRRLIVCVNAGTNESDPGSSYASAVADVEGLVRRLSHAASSRGSSHGALGVAREIAMKSNFTREDFENAVRKAKEYILAGDIFQVVLSQRFERATTAKPFEIYRALRAVNPSPYMFFLNFPKTSEFDSFSLVGSSPEVMVRIENGKITLRPIAGTRPRGAMPEEDLRLERELLCDEKELAEHIMLVDLGRNDVGRAAKPGSVTVDELKVIERYSHVMHIVSNVTGQLSEGETSYGVIRAAFPAGTVSGAPKIRAMEIIRELEPTARATYAGAAGYIGFDGNADTAIILRTLLVTGGTAYIQAGAGIVHDSVPATEYEESVNKARAMVKALEWAEAGL